MDDKTVYDVDAATDVKSLLMHPDVVFDPTSLKDKIRGLSDSSIVRVGKIIGSLKVVSVDVIDDDFLSRVFTNAMNAGDTDDKDCASE